MSSGEHVKSFVFPRSGQDASSVVETDESDGLRAFVDHKRGRRGDGLSSKKRRLRTIVDQGDSQRSDTSLQSAKVLRPAFAKETLTEQQPASAYRQRLSGLGRQKKVFDSRDSERVDAGALDQVSRLNGSIDGSLVDSDQPAEQDQNQSDSDQLSGHGHPDTGDTNTEAVVATGPVGVEDLSHPDDSPAQNVQSSGNAGSTESVPEILQQALDAKLQEGIEQGRREALAERSEEVTREARDLGFESGQKAGFDEGFQAGLAASKEELLQRLNSASALLAEIENSRQLLAHRQVVEVSRLLERLVMEVVRVELRHSPEQIQSVVEEAVYLLDRSEHETLAIRLHPDDVAWVGEFIDSQSDAFALRPDPQVTRGGCKVEGRLGHVDATLEERLTDCIEQLRSSLLEDPEILPPIDLSPVKAQESVPSYRRPPSVPASHAQQPATMPSRTDYSEGKRSKSAPGLASQPVAGLGAWGDLGQ